MRSRRTWWWVGVRMAAGLGGYFWPRDATSSPSPAVAAHPPSVAPATPRSPGSAILSLQSPRTGNGGGEVIAANWKTEKQQAFTAFRDWTARYLAASPADRAKLLAEGLELARQRREVLAQL